MPWRELWITKKFPLYFVESFTISRDEIVSGRIIFNIFPKQKTRFVNKGMFSIEDYFS